MKHRLLILGLWLPWALSASEADIQQAIEEGQKAYQAGLLSQAAAQFDYVATLIRQQQAAGMGELFPAPLDGWQAEEVSSQAGSAAFFGGGINASRVYRMGDKRLEIVITKDSPLLQTMAMLFTNPSMAAMGGYQVKRIQGQTAMFKEEGSTMELQMLIANRLLLQLNGQGISEAELNAYADAIDYQALTKQ